MRIETRPGRGNRTAVTSLICVFGASGRTGRAVVAAAQSSGVAVRACCRAESRADFGSGVEVIRGGCNTAHIRAAVSGVDAVVCVLGPRPPYRDVFCAEVTSQILEGMAASAVTRLVCQTGAMIDPIPHLVSRPLRLMAALFERQRPLVAADRRAQEAVVRGSSADWTLVKPPRIAAGASTNRIEVGPRVRVGLRSLVRAGDLGALLVELARSAQFVHERVHVRACG